MSLCLIQPDPWECTGCVNNNKKPRRLHLIFNLEVLPCGPKEIECWPVSWGSLCEVEGHCFPHASPLCAFLYTPLCVPCTPQGDPMPWVMWYRRHGHPAAHWILFSWSLAVHNMQDRAGICKVHNVWKTKIADTPYYPIHSLVDTKHRCRTILF